jgi:ribonuclease P protein component
MMTDDANTAARPPSRHTLPRSARVRARAEFDRVFKDKNRASDAWLTVYVASGGGGPARLGIAASKRLGNAVVRNRTKRLVRESFRRQRLELPRGTDWVVVPRHGHLTLPELDASLRQLIHRLIGRITPAECVAKPPSQS